MLGVSATGVGAEAGASSDFGRFDYEPLSRLRSRAGEMPFPNGAAFLRVVPYEVGRAFRPPSPKRFAPLPRASPIVPRLLD